jgi:Immunoglobulin I-set domain
VIKEKPKIIKIIKKRTVIIECIVASKFEPQCTWFKESSAVKESSRHMVQISQVREGEFAVKLEINQVKETDKGSYKLVAKNEKGEATSQVVELLEIPPLEEEKRTKPQIGMKLSDLMIDEGRTLDLIISLKSMDKQVKVVWSKNAMTIKESKEIIQTFDGTTARLTINNVKVETSGTYKVIVSNELGSDESVSKIIVNKKEEKRKKDDEDEEAKKKKKKLEEEQQLKRKKEEEEAEESKKKKSPFDVKLKPTEPVEKKIEVTQFSMHFSTICVLSFMSFE